MKHPLAILIAAALPFAVAHADSNQFNARLAGAQEVPSVSTDAIGSFRASLSEDGQSIEFELTYDQLEGGDVQQAHIHLGQPHTNGGVSAFLCTNLGNGPADTPACPAPPAIVTGTITAEDVVGPSAQGIGAGELDELIDALHGGYAYVNVHTATYPTGEIRSQLGHPHHGYHIPAKRGDAPAPAAAATPRAAPAPAAAPRPARTEDTGTTR